MITCNTARELRQGCLGIWTASLISGLAFHFYCQAALNPRHMSHWFGPKPAKPPFLVGRLPRTPFRPATTRTQRLQKSTYRN